MRTSQEMTPASSSDHWRVAGWKDEEQHAGKLCRALGYESDDDGRDFVRVEFADRTDITGSRGAKKVMSHEHSEVDLRDVLKQRVEAGEPIYIASKSNAAIEPTIEGIAKETGKPVRVVQIVETDVTSLKGASPEFVEAVLANSIASIPLKR
ncbi:hypothetical protein BLA39750_01113 [Burkholderia lata]|uniref:Uncharacterized protein n=1 Tax=Burkholderia lata (strain ATCC 17760 / DSM 23089 / LMG 22485 / NCIMB 9086 / R18194 / 383) TaxID=482957 RepID=A0A6P2VAZ6_BURL3|nr:hypothetical protein [Burkholderia lata]VWC79856.1 hypothetical protein BLA39750_01113 [Burkholderia lata]